uniref:Proline-rich protein 2-like n=1 Tax=Callorhinus ursinus TaxID=34884 RepID=A0A3Q7MIQ8_CALUR|nr:proline-rich protein 2-like [Callorhinus ursinus]
MLAGAGPVPDGAPLPKAPRPLDAASHARCPDGVPRRMPRPLSGPPPTAPRPPAAPAPRPHGKPASSPAAGGAASSGEARGGVRWGRQGSRDLCKVGPGRSCRLCPREWRGEQRPQGRQLRSSRGFLRRLEGSLVSSGSCGLRDLRDPEENEIVSLRSRLNTFKTVAAEQSLRRVLLSAGPARGPGRVVQAGLPPGTPLPLPHPVPHPSPPPRAFEPRVSQRPRPRGTLTVVLSCTGRGGAPQGAANMVQKIGSKPLFLFMLI